MKASQSGNARKAIQVVVAAGVAVGASQAVLADDIFLRITGLPGESTDSKHKDDIDVVSFAQSVDERNCARLNIVKHVDTASPGLADAVANGKPLNAATLVVRRSGAKDQTEYYKLTLTSLAVTGVDQAFSREGSAMEEVTLSPRFLTVSYVPQKADGSLGKAVETTLNCKK